MEQVTSRSRRPTPASRADNDSRSSAGRLTRPANGLFSWKFFVVWIALLPVFLEIVDARRVPFDLAYTHALQTFVHGYFEESQTEADQGYRQSIWAQPAWARKFQLLEAKAMAGRRLDEDALGLLAENHTAWLDPTDRIQYLAIEADSLTNLHRFPQAQQRLAEANALCLHSDLAVCTSVIGAQGKFLAERGQMADASRTFETALLSARRTDDRFSEALFLCELGYVASQREEHDQAIDFDEACSQKATEVGAKSLQQSASGSEGWEQYQTGNPDRALDLLRNATQQAIALGNKGNEIDWLTSEALIYASIGQTDLAEKTDLRAIKLAQEIDDKQNIINASMDLAQDYVNSGRPDEADRYSRQALPLVQETGSQLDLLNIHLIQGQAASLRHDWPRADALLKEVSNAAGSQDSMKWDAQRSLANMYEAQGQVAEADQAYLGALGFIEGTRAALKQEELRLTFLTKAARIYDDYIHFLVANGKVEEALEAADWSRARTLQQGLGTIASGVSTAPPRINAVEIARKANATLLFYWLGERQSYLWVVSPSEMRLVPLPPKSEVVPQIERYRHALLDLKDPLKDGNRDGRALYDTLVVPAAKIIPAGGRVVLFADGELSELNFETLVVDPNKDAAAPHFWIEDATILSSPSIRLFASAKPPEKTQGKLLLLGDSISPGPEYPPLPMAPIEIQKIRPQFSATEETIFTRDQATPDAYLKSNPEQFTYIHFVSHGTASRLDPLGSAVILSRGDGGGPYKLYARDILRHPINARLVTISACDSSGARAIAGEGLVGVSWAFLRAGAHNAIGALWDVSDASTPELMDRMYSGLGQGQSPAEALRDAKLSLVHAGGKFSKPFYWAPFQLYAGR